MAVMSSARAQLKQLQEGTPLLLRTIGASGQEELQICLCCISEDLTTLKWTEKEGTGTTHEVLVSAIVGIDEEPANQGIVLTLRRGGGEAGLSTMTLICASAEDLLPWREGLKLVVAVQRASTSSSPSSPSSPSPQQRGLPEGNAGGVNQVLRRENEQLKELLKRKDETIAELRRKLQEERGSKTMDSTRESERHLHDRDVAILQRKNRRLRQALKGKQQTVSELLKLVGKVTAQQGAESSAAEDLGNDDGESEEDEDEDEDEVEQSAAFPSKASKGASALVASRKGAATRGEASPAPAPPPAQEDESSEDEEMKEDLRALTGELERLERDMGSMGAFEPPPRAVAGGRGGVAPAAAAAATRPADAGATGPAALLAGLQGLLAMLPPGEGGSSGPATGSPAAPAGGSSGGRTGSPAAPAPAAPNGAGGPAQLLQALAAAAGGRGARVPPPAAEAAAARPVAAAAAAQKVIRGGGGAADAGGRGSAWALQALEKEMALLEEKKRIVERLSRSQPDMDDDGDDEDDGFPLR